MSTAVLLQNISKSFGGVLALDKVNLQVQKGSIHALVGENGAGKTTLMKILYGVIQSDSGTIEVDSIARQFKSSHDASVAGIGMVNQHYSIVPGLTNLENLMLGSEPGLLLKKSKAKLKAQNLADQMGFHFDWEADSVHISPASAQKLEILKLLWRDSNILILDEPTAMLSPYDSDELYASLKMLVSEGKTAIVVTHRTSEVLSHSNDVTVLRGGKLIKTGNTIEFSQQSLAEDIIGKKLDKCNTYRYVNFFEYSTPVIEGKNLSTEQNRDEISLKSINLSVFSGEIVGIAGVDGNGQSELFQALLGVKSTTSSAFTIFGKESSNISVSDRYKNGLRLIGEDRLNESAIGNWSLDWNSALGLQDQEFISSKGFIKPQGRKVLAENIVEKFSVKYNKLSQPISDLSGGNQQRFVAGRAFQLNPKLILAFQPARGLDLGATQQVYQALQEEAGKGCAVIVVSFDLDELIQNCQRVLVMFDGQLISPPAGQELDRNSIGSLMVGAAE